MLLVFVLFEFSGIGPAGPNWTSISKCKRRRKPFHHGQWKDLDKIDWFFFFFYFSSCVKASSVSQTLSFISAFKQQGRWRSGWWWWCYRKVCVWVSVCNKAGEKALCFAQQMHCHGPADGDGERKAIIHNTTSLLSHPRLIFSLSSLSSVLPLILFPLLYFHLPSLTVSLSPLPF